MRAFQRFDERIGGIRRLGFFQTVFDIHQLTLIEHAETAKTDVHDAKWIEGGIGLGLDALEHRPRQERFVHAALLRTRHSPAACRS
jgi:hypothetical protein